MALTYCRECGGEVSSEAVLCPHCGLKNPGGPARVDTDDHTAARDATEVRRPMIQPARANRAPMLWIIIGVVVIGLIAAWYLGYLG